MDMSPNKYTRALRMKIQERSLGQASKMVKYVSVQFRAGLGACSESQEASQSTNQVLGPPGQGYSRVLSARFSCECWPSSEFVLLCPGDRLDPDKT